MSCDSNLSYRETKLLAFKLRREDPQQFQTLVRMHLSFILELVETEGSSSKTKSRPLKWGKVHFSKKIKTPERETSDNAPISTGILPQINTLVDFLSKEENVSQEGIFRRSGKVTRQQELKNLLRQGECPELNDGAYSVHDVATVLKGFLADLSEPLLTDLYYPAYSHVADLCRSDNASKSRVLRALQLLFLLLPIENRKVLKRILELLNLTAAHVSTNRMSSQNLATLFTPHLLCPRKLSPENFHTTAQSLSCVVVFIINHAKEVFEIPPSLATDIKAYWDRRQRTPDHLLERSMSESTAASTVFSFVNREMSAADSNPTETALAQLYAHIQGLPESSKKKRLIKQFNKENGQGTPRTKSIGVSIKKHIFCKNAKAKGYHEFGQIKNGSSSSDEMINSPPDTKTPMRYKDLDDKDSLDTRCIKAGMKRFQTALESETDESPPKIVCERSREEPEAGGGHDHTEEPEASGCSFWFESLSVRDARLDDQGDLEGWRRSSCVRRSERGRGVTELPVQGLPILEVSPDNKPPRPELLEPAGGLRPELKQCGLRRGARKRGAARPPRPATPYRVTPLLPRRRLPSIWDVSFWEPPIRL